jgi:hypothetical protein
VSVYERLEALNIALPKLTSPVAALVPFQRSGNLIFLAGHIAKLDGQPWVGQLGANLTNEQGKNAARAVAIECDAQVFKKYSQMKLQMKREAQEKLNRRANEVAPTVADALMAARMCTVTLQ